LYTVSVCDGTAADYMSLITPKHSCLQNNTHTPTQTPNIQNKTKLYLLRLVRPNVIGLGRCDVITANLVTVELLVVTIIHTFTFNYVFQKCS